MDVRRTEDPSAFARDVLPLLLRSPARHNLMLGILDLIQRRPEVYPTYHLWSVTDGAELVGAALRTPPHNLVLAEPDRPEAIGALVDAIAGSGEEPPGVVGALPEARAFGDAWSDRVGGLVETSTRQGVYALSSVRDPGDASGAPRRATADDLDLLAGWHEDFITEAVPLLVGDAAMRLRRMEAAVEEGGYWLWEDGDRPVSMTGASPAPPEGARVGPVYTPVQDRRRGYATTLVAHVSAHELAEGRSACYLHTDLANPTSNDIYMRIGYDWVCEAVDLRFVDQSQSGGTGA
jgi:predicted GNAT family acetyltransferase